MPYSLEFEGIILSGFSKTVIDCSQKLADPNNCCPITPKLSNKPWAYKFDTGAGADNCDPIIKRRTEKGWTLDFIFNRENLSWAFGGVFYYLGVRGDNDPNNYADNNLSFQFTSDRKIKWVAHHYSGYCATDLGYQEVFYTASGLTPTICATDETKDFNVTITFDRYKHYTDCDIENDGGWNDLLPGPHLIPYTPTDTGVTSTHISTGYYLTNSTGSTLSGETEVYVYTEELNKKWANERQRRLGTLKIYLNGRPIYKLENWEEVIPSSRGVQPFIQSWGGGTGLMNNIHSGVCCFNMKSIKYYEEPLDFVHVRHNFLTRLSDYDFNICGGPCEDEISGFVPASSPTSTSTPTPTPTRTSTPTPTPTPTLTLSSTSTPTPTPTLTSSSTSTPTPTPTATQNLVIFNLDIEVSSGSIIVDFIANSSRELNQDTDIQIMASLNLLNDEILDVDSVVTILSGQTSGTTRVEVTGRTFDELDLTGVLSVGEILIDGYAYEVFADLNFITPIPNNDFTYVIIPDNNLVYIIIPNNDLTYTLIPSNDLINTLIPNNDLEYLVLPLNDVNYTLIPNSDLTYTLIPNNDIEYNVLKPGNSFYGQIILGESDIEGTCNCPEWECPRFYVTGDGPTFCDSNIFVTNGDGFGFNGWGTIVHNGFYKTVNMDGTNIATYRTDCGTCPTPTPTLTSTLTPTPTPTPTSNFGSSGFQWMTINSVTDSTASGIGQNDITLSVTQSGGGMGATEGVFNPTVFPQEYGVPFTGSQIQNINSGTFTATFSQPVTNPLVAFASIGQEGVYVPIEVSAPFTPIFGQSVTYQNPVNGTQYTQLTGNEGYAIIRIDGTVTTVTFNYTVAENYCNICFGFVDQNNLPTPTPTSTPTLTPTLSSTPTPTPTITYYYYYLLNCNLGDNKYGRSTDPSLSGNIFNVDTNTCYIIVGNDYGPSYDYDLDVATMVTDCTDILCSVATSTPTPTSTETPTPTPTLTSSSTPTPTPTSTESPLDFTISSDCINGGAVYTNNHIGGSGVYDRGTGLYDSESEALNETGWIQISNPINTVSSGVPYFNTTRTYWIALRDRNNQSNVVAKSILVDCTPTPTPTSTSAPTPTPTATSTPTPTSTLPPLNFTISGICQNDGSISISNLVGSVSNNYQYTGGIHTTENSALNATFWGSIVGGNVGVVTIGSSGTYWVAVRETENPSNIIAKSVTINCVETSGLVLHYDPSVTFSYPGTGTTINDLTGQGRTGTMSNITFTSPYLTFNGTSSQISVPDSIGLEPQTGDFTFEAWIYHSVITGSQRTFMSKTDNGGGASDWSYGLRTNDAGATYLEIGNGTTAVTSPSYTVSTGQWYQIVGVWTNISSNSITLYVNGISQGSNSHSFTSVKNSTNPLYLGNYNGNEYQQSLNGRMGIVRMYNKSLTPSEVLGNYNTDKSKYGL